MMPCPTCGSKTHGIEELIRFPKGDGVGFYEKDVEEAIERMAKEMMGNSIAGLWEMAADTGPNPNDPECAVYYRDFWREMAREALKALYA